MTRPPLAVLKLPLLLLLAALLLVFGCGFASLENSLEKHDAQAVLEGRAEVVRAERRPVLAPMLLLLLCLGQGGVHRLRFGGRQCFSGRHGRPYHQQDRRPGIGQHWLVRVKDDSLARYLHQAELPLPAPVLL